MKIKDGFVLREVVGEYVAVATGAASRSYHGMIRLNKTGKFIWEQLAAGQTEAQIVQKLMDELHASKADAEADVELIVSTLREQGLLEDA